MQTKSAHYFRLAGLILGITLIISVIVLLIGYIYHWNEPVLFSNAFFIAGVIVIIIGGLTVAGGFSQRANFNILYAESAGRADLAKRSRRSMAEVTQRYGVMILLFITGLLLVGIAVAIGRFLVQ
jgi:hypothetical protein